MTLQDVQEMYETESQRIFQLNPVTSWISDALSELGIPVPALPVPLSPYTQVLSDLVCFAIVVFSSRVDWRMSLRPSSGAAPSSP